MVPGATAVADQSSDPASGGRVAERALLRPAIQVWIPVGETKRLELPLEVAVPPIVEARALNGNEVTVVVAPGNPKGIARPEVAVGRIEDRN